MLHPKFIITEKGELRLGRVRIHEDLIKKGEKDCYGGGYYEIDIINNVMLLYDESGDYGEPQWNVFETIKVSKAYRGLRIVYRTEKNVKQGEIEITNFCYV